MPHRRHTITVASSTLFFVCLVLHAQTGPHSQTSTPYNDVEAYKVYESLLPADWTRTVAHARRLLSQAQTGSSAHSYIVLSPVAFNMDTVVHTGHSCDLDCNEGASYVLESKDGIWNGMRWRGTSCAWAS
jgi:hypothetical protein